MGTIKIDSADILGLAELCAALLERGVQFTAYLRGCQWVVELSAT